MQGKGPWWQGELLWSSEGVDRRSRKKGYCHGAVLNGIELGLHSAKVASYLVPVAVEGLLSLTISRAAEYIPKYSQLFETS